MDGQHDPVFDPYSSCEQGCNHDLVRGVTIAELMGVDGPYPTVRPTIELPGGLALIIDAEPLAAAV